jgi:hypothetical protein
VRRPVRDERWSDPNGELWQVEKVVMWRLETVKDKKNRARAAGRYTVAHYLLRHVSGVQAKVKPPEFESWSRQSDDPFAGRRVEMNRSIGRGGKVLVLPASDSTEPVMKGEVYHFTCGKILIDKVGRKIIKGREAEWHIEFTFLGVERDFFMRRTPPNLGTPESASETEEDARIESSYTSNATKALDDLATVPPDWEDRGATERKVIQLKDRDDMRASEDAKRQRKAAKATLDATLAGLTPENQQALLAQIVSTCEAAQMKEAA